MSSKPTTTVRDATLALMRDLGMTTIFGNPGSTELPLFRDFPEDFRYSLALQECVAVGMADGYAQATRNAAFINLHSSAGLGHAMGNIFTAFKNQTPLVVTAGQQARSILPYEPFLYAQEATELPKPFVKWSIEPARAEDVPAAIARAYYMAMQKPQGPVFVSIPVDDWDRPCELLEARQVVSGLRGDPEVLLQVAKALSGAKAPALVVGAGVARDRAWAETIALAERHQAHVWVAPMSGRNSFPEDHALFAGFLTAGREAIVEAMTPYDVIVALGGPMSLYHTEGFGPHAPEGAQIFILTDNPAIATWAPVGIATTMDMKAGVAQLVELSNDAPRPSPAPRAPSPVLDGSIFDDRYLLQQISRLRPQGAVIVEEAPSSRGPMHDYLPICIEDGFYTCASGGLGHGLPAALGVALGRPSDKIIAVLGDGSSMYAIQGLWTAAQMKLNISFVIIKNGRYEALISFGRHFGLQRTIGTELPQMDFCGLAGSLGISAVAVSSADALDAALSKSFATPGPTLVEVTVE